MKKSRPQIFVVGSSTVAMPYPEHPSRNRFKRQNATKIKIDALEAPNPVAIPVRPVPVPLWQRLGPISVPLIVVPRIVDIFMRRNKLGDDSIDLGD
jgi:hypothetical protein